MKTISLNDSETTKIQQFLLKVDTLIPSEIHYHNKVLDFWNETAIELKDLKNLNFGTDRLEILSLLAESYMKIKIYDSSILCYKMIIITLLNKDNNELFSNAVYGLTSIYIEQKKFVKAYKLSKFAVMNYKEDQLINNIYNLCKDALIKILDRRILNWIWIFIAFDFVLVQIYGLHALTVSLLFPSFLIVILMVIRTLNPFLYQNMILKFIWIPTKKQILTMN